MYKLARAFFMFSETPLHAGSGDDLGLVDLPIQRERHTGFPKVEASSLKGAIREAFENQSTIEFDGHSLSGEEKKLAISLSFGPEDGDLHAGALGFTDARLLLFPVRSMRGVFAYVTCPQVIGRLQRDLSYCKIDADFIIPPANSTPKGCQLYVKDNKIVLEEYTIAVESVEDDACTAFAHWLVENIVPSHKVYADVREGIKKRLVVLAEDEFRDFAELSTEVITRTKIDTITGTVEGSALFNEEYLPTDSVLYSLALTTPIFSREKGPFKSRSGFEEEKVMEFFGQGLPEVIQLGGNATLGKGLIRIKRLGVE